MHAKSLITTLIAGFLLFNHKAQAETVFLDPASASVIPTQVFTVDVKGTGFTNVLDGGGFDLSFNSSVLNVESIQVNTAIWEFSPVNGAIDNVNGTIHDTEFNSFIHSNSGSFDIAQITFLTVGTGLSNLTLVENSNNPFAAGGNPVPVTFIGASITSSAAVPLPGAIWLFASALVGLGVSQRRPLSR
jgi:ribose/xylose/arabinose/galactoside ABC-type transport system permease subunit